jgi:phage shock protein A
MSLLNRFSTLLKKGADALLSPADDPREKFTYTRKHPRQILQQVSHALAQTQTFLHQLTERKTALESRLPELETEAREALRSNRESLARMILQRRQAILTEVTGITRQIQETQQEETRLMLVKQRVDTQIEALQSRQQVLAARYSAAEANVRLNESLTGVAETFSGMESSLEESQNRVDHMQARAAAVNDLLENGVLEMPDLPGGDSLSGKMGGVEEVQAVEAYLAVLKEEIEGNR